MCSCSLELSLTVPVCFDRMSIHLSPPPSPSPPPPPPCSMAEFTAVEQLERSREFVQGLPEVNKELVQYVIGLMVKVSGREG